MKMKIVLALILVAGCSKGQRQPKKLTDVERLRLENIQMKAAIDKRAIDEITARAKQYQAEYLELVTGICLSAGLKVDGCLIKDGQVQAKPEAAKPVEKKK